MSVETKITITCSRCGEKSTSDNCKQFCSKVNLPPVEHFNSFRTGIIRHMNKINFPITFGIDIKIVENEDLCPKCRFWIDDFFEKQADKIRELLEQEY